MPTRGFSDASLVSKALAGRQEAFAEIVSRYQSLVCSLAYAATGSLGRSEDIAQETFLAAWRQLADLREPAKLRPWLCGIVRNRIRNTARRDSREPLGRAQPLDTAADTPDPEQSPAEQTVSREESALLWQALENLPPLYRETLVLFYRERQSVKAVAAALELSEDAVKQRLTRGRHQLQAAIVGWVETTLAQTAPDAKFTGRVLSALPIAAISMKSASAGAAAKGSAMAKAAAAAGISGALLGVFVGLWSGYWGYKTSLALATSEEERLLLKRYVRLLIILTVGFLAAIGAAVGWAALAPQFNPGLFALAIGGLSLAFLIINIRIGYTVRRQLTALTPANKLDTRKPMWEYRSRLRLGGWPLVHFRFSGSSRDASRPVKAWIAGGDTAIGVLFACGGFAVAPVACGGCAIGLLSLGGVACGALAGGGLAVGAAAFGGLALGSLATGGVAVALKAALGGYAAALHYAQGGIAHAPHAADTVAQRYFAQSGFFRATRFLGRHSGWLIGLSVLAGLLSSWCYERSRKITAGP